jgi:hypothetical protein
MFLLINTQYACGTLPLRFDLRKGRLVHMSSEAENRRYVLILGTHSLLKLAILLRLIMDLWSGSLLFRKPFDLLRIIFALVFACFGFMDLHSGWKRTELVVATNSALGFYDRFQRKFESVSRIKQVLIWY